MSDKDKKEITKPISVQDRVKERIQAEFASLITEEEWDALIKKAIADLKDEPKLKSWESASKPSKLQEMITTELELAMRGKIQNEIQEWLANEPKLLSDIDFNAALEAANANAFQFVVTGIGGSLAQQVQLYMQGQLQSNGLDFKY